MNNEEKQEVKDNKEYWKDLNSNCIKCKNNCKQSSKATIVTCNFVKVEDNG